MYISFYKWRERAKFILLFIVFTCIVYFCLGWIKDWIQPEYIYEQPYGNALKVFNEDEGYKSTSPDMKERLKLFYWYGE